MLFLLRSFTPLTCLALGFYFELGNQRKMISRRDVVSAFTPKSADFEMRMRENRLPGCFGVLSP